MFSNLLQPKHKNIYCNQFYLYEHLLQIQPKHKHI